MPHADEIRLFISSTFRDMGRERDHLVKVIFPEIRALCRERGLTFTEIDLRWGLTEEEGALGRIITTCLEEIDRCRPYFLGVIGERYGWVPSYHEVAMDPRIGRSFPWVEEAALDGVSILEMEFRHAIDEGVRTEDGFLFYRRSDVDAEPQEKEKLDRLAARVEANGYAVEPYESVEEFGERVRADLMRLIEASHPLGELTPLERERRAHAAFAATRRRAYIPDPDDLAAFDAWLAGPHATLVVHGPSGSGKSALGAWLAETARRRGLVPLVVEHYIGGTPDSGGHIGLMQHVMREIKERFDLADDPPEEPAAIESLFPDWLARATAATNSTLILIDGIDQLPESARRLDWMPADLPDGVRMMLTARSGPTADLLLSRDVAELVVRPLTGRRREAVVARYLGEYHKALPSDALRRIADHPLAALPLFLRTLCEELRVHGEHESLVALLNDYLGAAEMTDLFGCVLSRMESDYGAETVETVLMGLDISRHGLRESELTDGLGVRRASLSALLHALDFHLLRTEGRMTFFHDYLRRAVKARYAVKEDLLCTLRRRLADVAVALVDDADVERLGAIEREATRECLHQLHALGEEEALRERLADPRTLLLMGGGDAEYELMEYWRNAADPVDIPTYCQAAASAANEEEWESATRVDVAMRRARLYRTIGEWDAAYDEATACTELAEECGSDTLAAVLDESGRLALLRGRYDEALTTFERENTIAEESGDARACAVAAGNVAAVHLERGNYAAAIDGFTEMREASRRAGDRSSAARAALKLGEILSDRNDRDGSRAYLQEAHGIYTALGDRRGVASACGQLGLLHWRGGEYDAAMTRYAEESAICDAIGDRQGHAMAIGKIGLVHLDRADLDGAESCFRDYLALTERLGYLRGVGFAQGDLGIVMLRRGRIDEARHWFDDALGTHRAIGFRYGEALWLTWSGELMVERMESGNGGAQMKELASHARTLLADGRAIAAELANGELVERIDRLVGRIEAIGG